MLSTRADGRTAYGHGAGLCLDCDNLWRYVHNNPLNHTDPSGLAEDEESPTAIQAARESLQATIVQNAENDPILQQAARIEQRNEMLKLLGDLSHVTDDTFNRMRRLYPGTVNLENAPVETGDFFCFAVESWKTVVTIPAASGWTAYTFRRVGGGLFGSPYWELEYRRDETIRGQTEESIRSARLRALDTQILTAEIYGDTMLAITGAGFFAEAFGGGAAAVYTADAAGVTEFSAGIGTTAVDAGGGLDAGTWPAIMKDGVVYYARMHNVAWDAAGRGAIQKYGMAIIDSAGKVIGWVAQ